MMLNEALDVLTSWAWGPNDAVTKQQRATRVLLAAYKDLQEAAQVESFMSNQIET